VTEPTAPFGLMDIHGDGSHTAESRREIESELAQRVRRQARRHAVSAATLFHAAWALVVARTSGHDAVVFGTVLLGRLQGRVSAQQMLGMFINSLPVRLQLRNLTARSLVEQTQRELVDLLHHEQASLAVAHGCSSIGGSAPLFTALLNYRHNVADPDAQWLAADGVTRVASRSRTNYPIVLSVDDLGEGFWLSVQTDTRINPHRVLGYVQTALRSLVHALEDGLQTPALDLSVVPAKELRVIQSFNATEASYSSVRLIHELFERQVECTPKATAVISGRTSLSYSGLNARANQLARYLGEKGVGPEDLVGVFLERSLETIVALMGVLKAGAAYVPLDPSYPSDRIAFMLQDACPKAVLIQERLRDRLPEYPGEIIAVDNDQGETKKRSRLNLKANEVGVTARNLAYLIYTSGSTGKPKGVSIEHHNAVNLIRWACSAMDPQVFTETLHSTSFNFDLAVYECFVPLSVGGSLRLVENALAVREDPGAVTLVNTVPSAMKAMIDSGTLPRSTRVVNLAGEVLKQQLAEQILALDSVEQVCNLYGPSETTTYSTWVSMHRESGFNGSIGKPVANTKVHILDARGRVVPLGVIGEIYIGGDGVARGYLNRPDLTAQRFLADPFSIAPNARMYKTGDIGRWQADGTIEYLGRNDHQVKIRGFRIELGEIEARLVRHRTVKEAVVIAREDSAAGKRLVAYVTSREGECPTINELRAHVGAVLPEYMIPSAFLMLPKLPITPNGKLDRAALPAPELGVQGHQDLEEPQGEIEERLAKIWQDVLEVKLVGREDSFFELGGHSLLVLRALLVVNETFHCSLSIRDVYASPTLKELAVRIQGGEFADDLVDLITEATLDPAIVAQPGQRRNSPQAVMLTGATGFVGRFLLAQLLQDTDATIYCMVRSASLSDAAERLRTALKKWNLWREDFEARIVVFPGDLRAPRLGIVDRTYLMLSQNIDQIYHCATSMNHLESYSMAKRANVESAKELLKLATAYKSKLVNYISTLGVFSPVLAHRGRVVSEATSIDHERHSTTRGYAASKWVSEKIMMIAGERGIPCNIFRLGLIWADTAEGRYDELQREYRVLESCLRSGYGIKNYRYDLEPTPVDYVARAIVFLADHHRSGRGIFHLSSGPNVVENIFERCNEIAGTALDLIPFYEWTREIKRLHETGLSLPVVPLIEYAFRMDEASFYERERGARATRIRFDSSRTHRELERAGIVAPSLSDESIRGLIDWVTAHDPGFAHRMRTRTEQYSATIGSWDS
jgi:amino acid adenylation domain-containing protein/thioester reductase-like protein